MRPGGGRPKGKKDGPLTLRQTRKREWRELYETEAVRILGAGDRRKAVRKLVAMRVQIAISRKDPRALEVLEDRIMGKVPQPLQHEGKGGGPIGIRIYRCELFDGAPAFGDKEGGGAGGAPT